MLAYLIVLLTFLFAYLGFGLFLLKFFKLKFSPLERLLFAMVLSISLLSLGFVLLGYLVGTLAYYLLIPCLVIGAFSLRQERRLFSQIWLQLKKRPLLSFLILLAITSLSTGLFFSGSVRQGYLLLQDTYDSPWHLSLIKESLRNLPPRHPSNPKILLNNYHYFYDVFLASLGFLSKLPILNLHYQVGQLLMATLLILSAIVFGRRFKSNKASAFLVFFTAFVGNFAYFIPLFLPNQAWSESSFWVSQTFSMMVNPQLVFSFVTFYLILTLLTKDFYKKPARHYLMIALILPSIGFKSYGWILMSLLYAMDLLINFFKEKKIRYIIYGLIYLILALPLIYLMTGFKSNSFFYHPLWFIDTMVEAPDRLNHLKWRFLLDHYLLTKNYPRIFALRAVQIAIFYLGNLGTRAIFLLFPIWRLIKRKAWKKHQPLADLLFILFLISSIFPLLFLQRGTVWNAIQFWYYSLIFANILAVLVYLKLSKNWKKWQQTVALILLIALSVPSYLHANFYRWQSFKKIPENQVQLLTNLAADEKIMICPDGSWWYRHSIVSALTPAEVYLADSGQVNLLNLSLQDFEDFEELFLKKDLANLEKLIREEEIDHILCADENFSSFIKKLNWQEQEFSDWRFFSAEDTAK